MMEFTQFHGNAINFFRRTWRRSKKYEKFTHNSTMSRAKNISQYVQRLEFGNVVFIDAIRFFFLRVGVQFYRESQNLDPI